MARRSYRRSSTRRMPARGSKGRFVRKGARGRKSTKRSIKITRSYGKSSSSKAGSISTKTILLLAVVAGGGIWYMNKRKQDALMAAAVAQSQANAVTAKGAPFPMMPSAASPVPTGKSYMSAISDLFKPTMQPG